VEEELEDGEEEQIRVDDFIRDATNLRITTFQLDGYANEYVEMRRAQTAHLVEMDNLRNENRQLKARIKKLEEEFAQTETEHCDVINQLVRAKIEKEEYEAELTIINVLSKWESTSVCLAITVPRVQTRVLTFSTVHPLGPIIHIRFTRSSLLLSDSFPFFASLESSCIHTHPVIPPQQYYFLLIGLVLASVQQLVVGTACSSL
ncbi:16183_t:CDS:2, partial [Acaulospora colombiana]